MWYNITQYKNTIENLEPQTYSPVCLELLIFWVVVVKFWGVLMGCFSFLETRELFCQWSLKGSLLPTVVTGLHLACAAWIVCRAEKLIWICHHSEEYHTTSLNHSELKAEVFNVWKQKTMMASFRYNQKGSPVHAVVTCLATVSETDISSVFPYPSSWRASLNFPFCHGQDLWLGLWT